MQQQNEYAGVVLAEDGKCRAHYSATGARVRVRVGGADVLLTPAEFLSVCGTLLRAARALGRQERIAGLAEAYPPGRRPS